MTNTPEYKTIFECLEWSPISPLASTHLLSTNAKRSRPENTVVKQSHSRRLFMHSGTMAPVEDTPDGHLLSTNVKRSRTGETHGKHILQRIHRYLDEADNKPYSRLLFIAECTALLPFLHPDDVSNNADAALIAVLFVANSIHASKWPTPPQIALDIGIAREDMVGLFGSALVCLLGFLERLSVSLKKFPGTFVSSNMEKKDIIYQRDEVTVYSNNNTVLKQYRSDKRKMDLFPPPSAIVELMAYRKAGTHPNIAQLTGVQASILGIGLSFPCYDTSFEKELDGNRTPESVRHHLHSLCSALAHLHALDMAHRDIKKENIRFSNSTLILLDLGLSSIVTPSLRCTSPVVTIYTRPPEIMKSTDPYDAQMVDMWSFGCMIYTFAHPSSENLFTHNDMETIATSIERVHSKKSSLCQHVSDILGPSGVSLMWHCLSMDPKNRPSAQQALLSPFLRQTNK